MDIIDNESNRPLKYENRLWSFILNLEAFVELNLDSNEALLNETVLAIDYVLEHLEKKTSTPGEIQKFLTLVFYAQATLVECYTKIVRLDRANEVRTNFLLLPLETKDAESYESGCSLSPAMQQVLSDVRCHRQNSSAVGFEPRKKEICCLKETKFIG